MKPDELAVQILVAVFLGCEVAVLAAWKMRETYKKIRKLLRIE